MQCHDDRVVWARQGWIWQRNVFSPADQARLRAWVQQIQSWPELPHRWLKYYEFIAPHRHKVLSRVENFLPFHRPIRDFLFQSGALTKRLTALMGATPILFKDKVNFKPPGGGCYTVHQDAPAYRGFGPTCFVTVMIPVDDSTEANGCLEFAAGPRVETELPLDKSGQIVPDQLQDLQFIPVLGRAGDLVTFDGLAPHRSGANRTSAPRRAIFLTFNRASEGDRRKLYFREKRLRFPPESERVAGIDYHELGRQFNLGNPFV